MLRRLSEGNKDIDVLNCVSVCRMLNVCRSLLDDYGQRCNVPRSALRVDEDFHYMRGKWGANDHEFKTKDMAWPTNSVFLQRNLSDTRPLNETLTLTFTAKKKVEMGPLVSAVRGLKSLLFKDGFDSRTEFFKRYEQRNVIVNPLSTLCCGCTYVECNHYSSSEQDHVLDEKSKKYLRATCAYCALKINKKCTEDGGCTCCLRMMRHGPWPELLQAVWKFVKHCRHFAYERCVIDLILEGNPSLISSWKGHHHHNDAVDAGHCGSEGCLLGSLCKPSDNGIRCVTCELQPTEDIGEKFIDIHPKINEDHARKQIAKRVNVSVKIMICPRGRCAWKSVPVVS